MKHMNITTKYNLEDKVYVIKDEKIYSARVKSVDIAICPDGILIEYFLEVKTDWAIFNGKVFKDQFSEDQIFSSKEDAINELNIYLKHRQPDDERCTTMSYSGLF